MTKTRGTMKKVPNVEVNVDTVYIRSNITKVEEEDFKGWEYDEERMPLNKYIEQVNVLGQLLTEREVENLMLGQKVTDLELKILELGGK